MSEGEIGMRDRFGVWHPWNQIRQMPRSELIRLFRMIPAAPYREIPKTTRSDRPGRGQGRKRGNAMP
jgi:hypothetical protein